MDNKDFWRVFHEHLEMVAGLAGEEPTPGGADEFRSVKLRPSSETGFGYREGAAGR